MNDTPDSDKPVAASDAKVASPVKAEPASGVTNSTSNPYLTVTERISLEYETAQAANNRTMRTERIDSSRERDVHRSVTGGFKVQEVQLLPSDGGVIDVKALILAAHPTLGRVAEFRIVVKEE